MLTFDSSNPSALLASLKRAIDQGHITTWAYDSDGDFTHTPPQWNKKAYMRPVVQQGRLMFKLLGRTATVTWEVYAVYHGRFIEAMTAHFHEDFTIAASTAKPSTSDNIAA